ncbi:HNH endonuclease [Streptomyces aureus]|uniref:HNH endonuclease n=1 Tax=Streptomyces aureus TaxID=193461 RepID=UPI00368F18A3
MGGSQFKFTEEQEADVVRRYRSGESAESIGKVYGCSNGPIIKILKRREAYSPKPWSGGPRRHFTNSQIADMVSRYEAGEDANAISRSYECSRDVVHRVLRERGVYRGRQRLRALTAAQEKEAAKRYGNGESALAIALSFGLRTGSAVERVLKAHGSYQPREFDGFTAKEEADMVARYLARESAESIRRSYGCSRQPVVTVLTRHGVYQSKRFQGFTPKERDEIVARYQAGAKPAQIARDFRCSQETIDRMLQRLGVWVSPRGLERVGARYTMHQKREMASRYESGDSIYKIGKAFEAHPQLIWSILNAAGVQFRDKAWRGGRVAASGGYIAVTADADDPIASAMATVTGYVLEHRLVMARSLRRPLTDRETVHHINGDKRDNRLENLQLRSGNHGKGVRLACLDCGSHNVAAAPLVP